MAKETVSDSSTVAAAAQAGVILNQIAELAHVIQKFGVELVDESSPQGGTRALTIREFAAQIGWLADLGSDKLGGSVCFGDAARWVLPPAYHAAAEVNHG